MLDYVLLACFAMGTPWTVLGFWNAAIGLWLLHVKKDTMAEVAPYAAHLVSIGANKEPRVLEVAEALHQLAIDAGREILWDDRDESPGVKFTDAELLGMPWILTVSPRSLAAGGIEVTERATGARGTRPIEEVEALLRAGG